MTNNWTIHVRDGKGRWVDDDSAPTEAEAREQASGWTGQRGQMTWVAIIFDPSETKVAVYRRGVEASN